MLGIASCNNEVEDAVSDNADPIVLKGIYATIEHGGGESRAVASLVDYVGKYEWLATDEIIFTKIARTKRPIVSYTYYNVNYACDIKGGNLSWKRQEPTADIFWSDGSEPHTFIGYVLPHADDAKRTEESFDWKKTQDADVYYGSVGDPTDVQEVIDYTAAELASGATGAVKPESNEKLRREDLLLAYDTNMQNEDAFANVLFHHGLASIRVVVTISGFSSTGTDPDAQTKVTDMLVSGMPMMYKWNNNGYKAAPLTEADQSALNILYEGNAPQWNQKKDMKLWQSREYYGSSTSRTFTFYGITAPTTIEAPNNSDQGKMDEVNMTFKVSYPDPLNPVSGRLQQTYKAKLKNVKFCPGYCTSINVNLNHEDEKLTVGAEYMSWKLDKSPDDGLLKKNSTFMTSTERSTVTILGDAKATVDDATWLYIDAEGKIMDIYGHDGSASSPFQISTAAQLLSFTHEVKGTDRSTASVGYKDLQGNSKTITGAFDFTGYHIVLDADITLQPKETTTKEEYDLVNYDTSSDTYKNAPAAKEWIGIGEQGKPFNGNFQGGGRFITRLYGSPFFVELGQQAHVEHLILSNVIDIKGDGGFANVNKGTICACHVDGNVTSLAVSEPVGSIAGTNLGLIFACYHTGDLTAENASVVGGLVGKNETTGKIVASYNAGKITTNTTAYGILGSETKDAQDNLIVTVFGCFYDGIKAHDAAGVAPAGAFVASGEGYPSQSMTTVDMMKSSFVGNKLCTDNATLNGIINSWAHDNPDTHLKDHYYEAQPANYPKVY